MNTIYKIYDPENKPLIFENLSELKDFLDLDDEDTKKVFYPGVHTIKNGDEVITIKD